jgi:hypothetical protein
MSSDQRDSEPDGPAEKLRAALMDFKIEVQDRVRDLNRAKKALEQICRKDALENLDLVEKYTEDLRKADLTPIECDDRRGEAVQRLDTYVDKTRRRRRQTFMKTLHREAKRREIEFEKISEGPLTLHIAPFDLEADFETSTGRLSYARTDVATVDLDVDAILEAHQREMTAMKQRSRPSPRFFERLLSAYQLAVQAQGESIGSRVDLVDLLAPLALLDSDPTGWRNEALEAIEGHYPRHLLSYQLGRLRRDGMLEHAGHRIDLGTATGGSTEDKRDVLFLPTGPDAGQYYLSIRFTPLD